MPPFMQNPLDKLPVDLRSLTSCETVDLCLVDTPGVDERRQLLPYVSGYLDKHRRPALG